MDLSFILAQVAMGSGEIAHMASKPHLEVTASIQALLAWLEILPDNFSRNVEVKQSGIVVGTEPGYHLSRNLLLTLICGWDIHIRAEIIRHWLKLEHEAFTHISIEQIQQLVKSFPEEIVTLTRPPEYGDTTSYTLDLEAILHIVTQYCQPISSSTIAGLTEKPHTWISTDIQGMFRTLDIDDTPYRVMGSDRSHPTYSLTKELGLILVTGYEPREMFALVKHWTILPELDFDTLVVEVEKKVKRDNFIMEYSHCRSC